MKKKKVYSKQTKIEFYTKEGEKIAFNAIRTFSKPLKIDFYAGKKKQLLK